MLPPCRKEICWKDALMQDSLLMQHTNAAAGTVEALQRQAAAAAQAQAGTAPPLHSGTQEGHTAPPISAAVALEEQDAAWEALHLRDNATARFYKERRLPINQELVKHGIMHTLGKACMHQHGPCAAFVKALHPRQALNPLIRPFQGHPLLACQHFGAVC